MVNDRRLGKYRTFRLGVRVSSKDARFDQVLIIRGYSPRVHRKVVVDDFKHGLGASGRILFGRQVHYLVVFSCRFLVLLASTWAWVCSYVV